MAHVFKDSPHSSSMMLHLDYYSWLFDTIKVASQSKNIDWIVKPHPASSLYNETGDVEDMINIINSSNIHLCYEDFNTKSIKYCADAIVTVYGTAGLEFACLGIPVLLAGRSFYAGHGFTIEPQTLSDYHKILLSMNKIKRLTENKINSALEVYAIWEKQFDWENPIITKDVLKNVWGTGKERNIINAHNIMSENLVSINPKSLKLWEYVQLVA